MRRFALLAIMLACAALANAQEEDGTESVQGGADVEEPAVDFGQTYYSSPSEVSRALYRGGFQNFGIWEDKVANRKGPVTDAERVQASNSLVFMVENELPIHKLVAHELPEDQRWTMLDIGSGLGTGCRLIAQEHQAVLSKMLCLDRSPHQTVRAMTMNTAEAARVGLSERLQFITRELEDTMLPTGSVDCAVSVEALQHVERGKLADVISEISRVLKPRAQLGFAGYFAVSDEALARLPAVLQPASRAEVAYNFPQSLPALLHAFEDGGFTVRQTQSIGAHVWRGFNKWVEQEVPLRASWYRQLDSAVRHELVDYFIVVVERHGPAPARDEL